MNRQKFYERLAVGAGLMIIVAGLLFWAAQIQDVIELLELAHGE